MKILESVSNLGFDLTNSGQEKEAESLLRGALERHTENLGPDHPSVLRCLYYVTESLCEQERWKEVFDLSNSLYKTQSRVLGEEHPQTLDTLNNLAIATQMVGMYEEAEKAFKKTLDSQEKVLGKSSRAMFEVILTLRTGPEHPDSLSTLNNLALLFEDQGRLKDAIALEQRVVETQEKVCHEQDEYVGIHSLTHTKGSWLGPSTHLPIFL